MKFLFISSVFFCFSLSINAQVQYGKVREINSNKRPLSGVQIVFSDAVPTTSDTYGAFRLAFSGKKPGDLIFLDEARKQGYELVNQKELEVVKISSSDTLGKDIILAKVGTIDAAKKLYYEVSDSALISAFQRERNQFRKELQEARIGQEEYGEKLTVLQEQFDLQQEKLDALASTFARVNFDDVGELYEEALNLFKAGDIIGSQEKLESADPIRQTDKNLKERERIQNAEEIIAREKAANEANIQENIQAIRLLVETYLVTLDFAKAEKLYDSLIKLDSTDLELLEETAAFYNEQHLYTKAMRLFLKIIDLPDVESFQKALAHGDLGDIYTVTGNLNKAMVEFRLSNQILKELYLVNPNQIFLKHNLAVSNARLGETHLSMGDLDSAIIFFEKYNNLSRENNLTFPDNTTYKNSLAISIERLGLAYRSLGNFNLALEFFEDQTKLLEELSDLIPGNSQFKNNLAVSFSRLGETHMSLGNLERALHFFERYNQLENELYVAFPNKVIYKKGLANSYEKLGDIQTALENFELALEFYEEDNQLAIELFESYPKNVTFKNGLGISYSRLGYSYQLLDDLDQALKYYQEDYKLAKELYEADSQNVSFKGFLSISYSNLGDFYMNLEKFDQALEFFEDSHNLAVSLLEGQPQNVDFKDDLALSHSRLGDVQGFLGNFDQELMNYEKSLELSKELHDEYPQNMFFKDGLATAYSRTAWVFEFRKKNTRKAKKHYLKCHKLWKELAYQYPQKKEFQDDLKWVNKALERTN